MTTADYARHRGVSERQVYRALRDGRIRRDAHGNIDPEEADRMWQANTDHGKARKVRTRQTGRNGKPATRRSRSPEQGSASGVPSLAESKRIEAHHRAELARVAAFEAAGRVVSVEDVERAVFEVHRRVRDRLLAMPSRLTPLLVGRAEYEIEQALASEVHDCLSELSTPPVSGSTSRQLSRVRPPTVRGPRVGAAVPTPPHP